jgi:hypothetical protein
MFREDPGPCPICGAAHTACSADSGPIAIPQLPARDAHAEEPPPEPVEFTTATYRGQPKKKGGAK